MKKMLAVLIACVLLLAAIPAMADNVRTSGFYTYEIKGNGTITITDFDWESNDGDVYIPNMIDGYTVTGIGDNAFSRIKPKRTDYSSFTVTLPESIKSIGERAFAHANIAAINIPSSVQYIGSAAFYGNPSCQFKVATIQNYFAVIDEGLYNKSAKELIAYSWKIAETTDEAVNIDIPEGIRSIGAYSFADIDTSYYGAIDLNISLPSTLVIIGDYAFANASWIDSLHGNLPNVRTIGEGAFKGCCIHWCSLTMGNVETIGDFAFSGAFIHDSNVFGNSYSVNFSNAPLNTIGENAFDEINELEKYGISVAHNVFSVPVQNCKNIGSDNPGLGMLMLDEDDFSPSLTSIPTGLNPKVTSLPNTITVIQSRAFTDVVADFQLAASVKKIAVDAFPKGSTFIVEAGSYAELWCSENGFGYSVLGQEDDLSWLTSDTTSYEYEDTYTYEDTVENKSEADYETRLEILSEAIGHAADCSSIESFVASLYDDIPLNADGLTYLLNSCESEEEFIESFFRMWEMDDTSLFEYN